MVHKERRGGELGSWARRFKTLAARQLDFSCLELAQRSGSRPKDTFRLSMNGFGRFRQSDHFNALSGLTGKVSLRSSELSIMAEC